MASEQKRSAGLTGKAGVGLLIVMSVLGCRSSSPQAAPKVAAGNSVAPRPAPAQNAAEEQGWTVYTSPSGNYKLSYPKTGEVERPEPSTLQISFEQKFETGRDVLTFQVIEHENAAGKKVQEWALQQWGDGDAIKEQSKTVLASQEAYRLKIFESDQYSIHIYTASGKTIYEVTCVDPQSISELPPDIKKQWTDVFGKIIASFSLLPPPRQSP